MRRPQLTDYDRGYQAGVIQADPAGETEEYTRGYQDGAREGSRQRAAMARTSCVARMVAEQERATRGRPVTAAFMGEVRELIPVNGLGVML